MNFKMKYEITPRYVPGASLRRPMLPLGHVRFLVAHDTGNPGSTAANNVSYYHRTAYETTSSAHLFVDDKEIIECIPFLTADPERAYHVVYNVLTDNEKFGCDANDAAGGVELCYGGGINLYEAYSRYVWVMAYSCYKFNLNPATDITGHFLLDPSRRTDPINPLKLLGKTFEDFIQDVIKEYNDCLISEEGEETLKLEDWQWTMMGDAVTGLSQVGQEKSGAPLLSYSWAEKCYLRELTLDEALFITLVAVARMKGVDVERRN